MKKTKINIPVVVIVFGLSGTGKSYFASRLAKLINAEYINSDRLRKELFPKRTYSDKEKEAVYKAMLEKMKLSIAERKNVVLDATFYKKTTRQLFLNEIKDKSAIFFIEITANENLARERLQKERPYSEADFGVYKLIQQQWEPMNEPHLTLDSTDNNIDFMIRTATDYLRK